jgi:hypothetical protein
MSEQRNHSRGHRRFSAYDDLSLHLRNARELRLKFSPNFLGQIATRGMEIVPKLTDDLSLFIEHRDHFLELSTRDRLSFVSARSLWLGLLRGSALAFHLHS